MRVGAKVPAEDSDLSAARTLTLRASRAPTRDAGEGLSGGNLLIPAPIGTSPGMALKGRRAAARRHPIQRVEMKFMIAVVGFDSSAASTALWPKTVSNVVRPLKVAAAAPLQAAWFTAMR